MFTSKQNSLFSVSNPFVDAGLKSSSKTLSHNGAEKFSSTGNDFVDQFGKLGLYRSPRFFDEIVKDQEILWANDPLLSVKFSLYLRTIPRKVRLLDGTQTQEVQKGGRIETRGNYALHLAP